MSASSHYYLPDNVDATTTYAVVTNWRQANICLHLNGHRLTSTNKCAIQANEVGTLNIMGSGEVRGKGWMGTLYVAKDTAVVNIYGGTFIKDSADTTNPVINLTATGGTVHMYGGQVATEGSTLQATSAAIWLQGGAFTLHDGTIYGITGQNAGSVFVKSGATLTVNGGRITGGKVGATNLDVKVETGGTLTNNTYVDVIDAVSFADDAYVYTAKCRHCDAPKTWTIQAGSPGAVTDSRHILGKQDLTNPWAHMQVNTNGSVCWALNGKTTKSGRKIRMYSGSLAIMGTGRVIGYDSANSNATETIGTIVVEYNGQLYLYGGTYETENAKPALLVSGTGSATNVVIHEGVEFVNNGTAANVVEISKDVAVSITGAKVNGTMAATVAQTKLTLAGKTEIDNLSLVAGSTLDVTGLIEGSDIKLTAPDGVFTTAFADTEDGTAAENAARVAGYFSIYNGDGTKEISADSENKLKQALVSASE